MKKILCFLFFIVFVYSNPIHSQGQIIRTVAGGGIGGDGIAATASSLQQPTTLVVDASGNMYIADWGHNKIRKVTASTGIITTIAGTGGTGHTGDGFAATAATLDLPNGVALDPSETNLYCAEQGNNDVRKINLATGIITTVAGTGGSGYSGDGFAATLATMQTTSGVAVDASGNIYIADWANNAIRKVDGTTNIITTIIGTVNHPYSVSLDLSGNLYISNEYAHTLIGYKLSTSTVFPVGGHSGTAGSTGDGGPATAAYFNYPDGIVADAGSLYIADDGNSVIRKIDLTTGIVTTIAGTIGTPGFIDDVPATACEFHTPSGVTLDNLGNIYISDFNNNRIREIPMGNHIPTFNNGTVQYDSLCENGSINITSLLTASDVDTGQTETWILYDSPAHGTIYVGGHGDIPTGGTIYTTTSTGGSLSTSTTYYIPPSGYSGLDSFTVRINDGISIDSTKIYIKVKPLPNPDAIRGPDTLCLGTPYTYLDDTAGGHWLSTNGSVATIGSASGIANPVTTGSSVIKYIVTNSCGSDTVSKNILVYPAMDPITPSSPVSVCVGVFFDLSDATASGTWSVSNGDGSVSSAGHVTGVSPGIDTVYYSLSAGCIVSKTVTINVTPSSLTPSSTLVCVGSTATLTDGVGAGTWSMSNGHASVSGGVVSGFSPGLDTVTYTIGDCSVIATVTVVAAPAAISPLTSTLCVESNESLTETGSGGVWSASNGDASVSGGLVSGVSLGVDTIYYTIYSGSTPLCSTSATVTVNTAASPISPSSATICVGSGVNLTDGTTGGTWNSSNAHASASGSFITGVSVGVDTIIYTIGSCSATAPVTVIAAPAAISPASAFVCAGGTVTLTDASGSGTWSVSNGHGSVSGGIVTGVSVGIDTITYSVGSCSVTATVTVNSSPAAISPASSTVCAGSTITLTDPTGSGSWSNSNAHATVSGGFVNGVSIGVDTISYTVSGCAAKATVTVISTPAAISPSSTMVCTGHTVTLTDASGGGTWSVSNGNGSVSGGIVTGVTAGVDTISYSAGGCGVTATVTVNASPAPISPSSSSVCAGSLTSLTDPSGSGTWGSSNGHASVTGGTVSGSSPGVDTITYTVSGCASMSPVTVNLTPTNISPASSAICAGSTITLTDGTTGGVWSSSNSHASVTGGTVTGLTAGVDTISYSLGSCTVMATVTVNAGPAAITPSGIVSVCLGTTTTLTDASGTITWSSGSAGLATVGSATGVVTGTGIGTATISFTNSFGCSAIKAVNVISNPAAISPASSMLCIGSSLTLTDATGGGAWSISNGNATIAGNTVTGVLSGVDTVTYTVGSCFVTATLTVNPVPSAITPASGVSICVGGTASLTDGTPGGTWSSGSIGTATVGTSGTVTGTGAGNVNISYTNSFGCAAVKVVTVSVTPTALSPSSTIVCVGHTATLTDGVSGGTWISSSGNATVASGLVTGVTVGTATITYTIGSCYVTAFVSVNPSPSVGTITGPMSECAGSSMLLMDGAIGGSWSSSNVGVATIGTSGSVLGISAGTSIISYSITNGCGITSATATITINAIPTGGTITGPSSVCSGTANPYADGVSGGVWSMTNSDASITGTGLLTAITPGTDTIKYTVTNTCGTAQAAKTITIGGFLTAGSITGANSVCQGAHITLTDLAPAGVWSSGNTAVATVGTSGIVTGVGGGVDTISYTVSASCGTATATHTVTVNPLPDAGSISGAAALCVGMVSPYTDMASGGTWSVSNTHATITGTGSVTAVTAGTVTVSYTVTNGCGTAIATQTVNIGATLTAGSITGIGSVCAGSSILLSDGTTGGVWSSSNGNASIAGGTVTGIVAGVDTISYTVTASCGTAVATKTVTVNPLPNAGSITGPSAICTGATTNYTETAATGTWSMSNAIATITAGGVLDPLASGIDTIRYTVTNGCGTAVATLPVTIGTSLSAGSLTGPGIVCIGSSITLTAGGTGGVWSASNGNATVSSSGPLSGSVTGVATGTDVISYTISGSCGTSIATATVVVSPAPNAGSISGPSAMCTGTTATYTNTATTGAWSISNANATITAGGSVTAVTAGLDTLSYTSTTGCGTATATKVVTIGTSVTAGSISGAGAVCVGSAISLTDAATGGTWSSSNGTASVSGGSVTGISAGTDTISYTVSGGCGTAVATATVVVSLVPVSGSIIGPSSLCVGTFTLYADTAAGTAGVWSVSNADATITAGGLVTALTAGFDTISYTTTNTCGTATASVVVSISPSTGVGSISGPGVVCIGSSITLTDVTSGGVWSSSNGTASLTSGGSVTGITTGTDTIAYTISASCGSLIATHVVSTSSLPIAGSITGPSAVCVSSLITLTDGIAGGAWSSSNTSATVTTGGVVTGIIPGTDTISYTVTNACGITAATQVITIGALPATGTISGPGAVCAGGSITLTDGTSGGTWSSNNTNATVGSLSGIVSGVSGGSDVISYTVANACGSASATMGITIDALPDPGTITGGDSVCISGTLALTDAIVGGGWSVGNTNATITGGGIVTGVSAGTTPVSYTVSNGCGTSSAVLIVAISTTPTSGTIVGSPGVCVGSGITLTDATPGGSWYCSNVHATVTGPGIIDGISVGTDTVFYLVSNGCGISESSKILAVNPVPVVAPITGPTTQCTSATITLSDGVVGGIWTSSNPSVATISVSTGMASGVSAGTTTITYTVTNIYGCPTSVTSQDTVVSVAALPAIAGSINVCIGSGTLLTESATGGAWSSGATGVASIDATGMVTGISAGLAMITYSVVNLCGSEYVTRTETVSPPPTVAPVTGTTHQCAGASATLSDATTGGTWSSSNITIATVGTSSGIVTGVGAGTVTINYSYTGPSGCSLTTGTADTVITAPTVAEITGVTNECIGGTNLLSNATPGGAWSSSSPAIATISGTGLVTGVAAGNVTIGYSVSNAPGCTTTMTTGDTVNTIPVPAAISGTMHVCTGSATTLTNPISGGTWSSGTTGIAAVDASGTVTGIAAGTDEIYYSISNSCGAAFDSARMTVNALPSAGTITALYTNICSGTSAHLSETATGGVWSSSDATIASVSSAGIVTGNTAGIATISYTVTGSTGCEGSATVSINVGSAIPSGTVTPTGSATLCHGHTVYMYVTTSGTGLTYQWLRNGGMIPGATNLAYTTGTAGSYAVIISNGICSETITGTTVAAQPNPVITFSSPDVLHTGSYATYQWLLNGVPIPGAISATYDAATAGVYKVIVMDGNGCTDTSAGYTINAGGGSNGVNNVIVGEDVKVYPNPATSTLHIDAPVSVNVTILSVDGKELITQKNATSIDISSLANGMYLVMIYDEHNILIKTTKFAKIE